MARKFSFGTYDKKHLRNLLRRAQSLADIFGLTANKAAKIGEATGYCDPNGEFMFDKFPSVKERVEELFRGLHDSLLLTITEGNREEWLLSAAKNDAMVDSLFGHVAQYGERAKEWKQSNLKALEAFQNRKERGMDLSERVWNLTNQFKGELELALELGLGDGKSAAALSRDVREYLNEPHKLFRRVRNEKGQLRLSKSAAAYHPGQGVYRSSYKNALRLTATENNMAYRSADHERWQQLDFVIGIEIMLSNNHPCEDICDELAGVYPKTFKFTGWHPFCRCIAVPKLADEDEFIARQQAMIDGKDVPEGGYSGEITEMPEAFNNWVQNNAERIESATNVPYFIRDNRVQVNKILKIKDTVKANVTANAIAAAIEANRREYERLKENPDYTDVAFNASSGGLKATHRGHNFDDKKGWYEQHVQATGYLHGHSVILEKEIHTIENKRNVEGLFDGQDFEIAGSETGTANNIRNALKHCASKPGCRVAVVFFPDKNKVSMAMIRDGLKKYFGLKNDPNQFTNFDHIYFMTSERIIYHQKKQGD